MINNFKKDEELLANAELCWRWIADSSRLSMETE